MTVSDVKLTRRVQLQRACAAIFAVLTIAALVIPIWIEKATGLSPDGGNGELEALLAIPFGVASIAFGALAWQSRRLLKARQLTR